MVQLIQVPEPKLQKKRGLIYFFDCPYCSLTLRNVYINAARMQAGSHLMKHKRLRRK